MVRIIPQNAVDQISGIRWHGRCEEEEEIPSPCWNRNPGIYSIASDFNDDPVEPV
jgi:hypothetical protein